MIDAIEIAQGPSAVPADEPLPGIHYTRSSAVAVVFSAAQAAQMLGDYPELPAIICVDVPRAALVTCLADAVRFYGGETG